MANLLESQLDGADERPENGKSEETAAIIHSIDDVLNLRNYAGKSNINPINLDGISRGLALNEYCERVYHFRIKVLDKLIEDRLKHIPSIKGKGREQMLTGIEAIKAVIDARVGNFSLEDRLMGKGRI